ncbi:MAG: GGDEF domain-containing protein [Phycisphaerae bacterium]|nr:GGDEF domain-containing protein [Phycisphaerae bacterium]
MSDAREISRNETEAMLLLSDDEMARELARHIERPVVCADSAYDALIELARRRCAAVVMTAPRPEMEGFARAVRRLNQRVRLLAVCRPDAPPEIRAEVERIADGCCSYPPTRGEINVLLRGTPKGEPPRRPAALSTAEIADLVQSACGAEKLEAHVAQLVSAAAGVPMRWTPADACGPVEPLLMLPGSPVRLLVPDEPFRCDEHVDALIADLHSLLPALSDTACRTDSLHRLAITDHLTGAYNRRYFYHLADHVLRRAEEEHFRATLLLYDIDDFKRYNDEYGHAAGDEILRDTALLMRSISREQDIVARIGGDEFAVLFWDNELREAGSQPLRDAWELADRFRRAVENHDLPSLGPHAAGELTISGGLAGFPEHGRCCTDLLRQADRALRAAKASGKNSIHLVGAETPSQ